jgi:hypothetical protein|tara:strand:- start:731 stop:964 length:234 start_codon:yes stop_codon:yes gene_type:complete
MRPNLQKITDEGYTYLGVHFGNVQIYRKDKQRLLYDTETDMIRDRYFFDEHGKCRPNFQVSEKRSSRVVLNGKKADK